MSFLKISDPLKRDSIVKEYLELKKNIRDNFLSERIGEQQLQTDLSKFYRPITETQKATTREITEGLKPIREGIEKLPESFTFPPTQPLGKATEEEEDEEDEEEEEEDESVGEIAIHYLNKNKQFRDITFGIRKEKGHHYIGNQHVIVKDNDIIIAKDGERFEGTPGLWELITLKKPVGFSKKDEDEYGSLMVKTNALYKHYDPNKVPRSSGSDKWRYILSPIWYKKRGFSEEDVIRMTKDKNYRKKLIRKMRKSKYEGKGVVVIPSDPNALLERLDLLLASQEAGHTGVRNELVSICDELKRQGVLDMKAYKKLNSNIKNDNHH